MILFSSGQFTFNLKTTLNCSTAVHAVCSSISLIWLLRRERWSQPSMLLFNTLLSRLLWVHLVSFSCVSVLCAAFQKAGGKKWIYAQNHPQTKYECSCSIKLMTRFWNLEWGFFMIAPIKVGAVQLCTSCSPSLGALLHSFSSVGKKGRRFLCPSSHLFLFQKQPRGDSIISLVPDMAQ